MRISDGQRANQSILALQASLARMDTAQQQITSGRRILRPSDDPTDAASATLLRAAESDIDRYSSAIGDAQMWLGTQDNALQTASTLLTRVKTLTVQASSGAVDANSRAALATEIRGIRDQLGALANTQLMGRSVFGSFATQAVTLTGTTSTFNGTVGAQVRRQIGANEFLNVNSDGAKVFGFTAGDDVFSVLGRLANDITAGNTAALATDQTALDARSVDLRTGLGDVGARYALTEARDNDLKDRKLTLTTQRSKLEDADAQETMVRYAQANTSYQAVLAAIAKTGSTSLVNFLR
jgi:flagellar hook-associated protein 3 FlgL